MIDGNDSTLFNNECNIAINKAVLFSIREKFEFITVDNFIYFISESKRGEKIFKALGIDPVELRKGILNFLNLTMPKVADVRPVLTVQFRDLLERASYLKKNSLGHNVLDEGYVIAALFEINDDESFVLNYLNKNNISRYDVMNFLTNNKGKEQSEAGEVKEDVTKKQSKKEVYLEKYAVLLNKKALNGDIDPLVGREKELLNMILVLSQRKKNNPILVGDPGVGKTALVEGFAKKIVEKTVAAEFHDSLVYALDFPALMAGARFRGDFEERIGGVLKEAIENPNIILFIDEIHTLVSSSMSGLVDASNILKPYLTNGKIKVIGATTFNEYRRFFEKDGALSRRFQKISIDEPSVEDSIKIIMNLKDKYEDFHKIKYEDDSISHAVNLTSKYMIDRFLPDKAIDLVDKAGANIKISTNKNIVTKKDIEVVFSKMAKIPLSAFGNHEKSILKNLSGSLKKEIFGQNDAIDSIVDHIILSRTNIVDKNSPVGSFVFMGPSGVGKTELASQLAKKLDIPFIRFDMSEFMEKHTISKLIGSPPGYVGHEGGGKLIDMVKKTPHAVLLLDEIEKGHPDLFNILLQIMDYGVLTDSSNEKADFKNIILIMTSNLGSELLDKKSIGFMGNSVVDDVEFDGIIKKHFSPEFFNRLSGVVKFFGLSTENITKIVNKNLNKIKSSLSEKQIIIFFTNKVVKYIADNGFDKNLGARPVERYIEKMILNPLSKKILFGDLKNGGEITVDIIDNAINFNILCSYNEEKNVLLKREKIMLNKNDK